MNFAASIDDIPLTLQYSLTLVPYDSGFESVVAAVNAESLSAMHDANNKYMVSASLHYEVYSDTNFVTLIDSGKTTLTQILAERDSTVCIAAKMKVPEGSCAYAFLKITDERNHNSSFAVLKVDRKKTEWQKMNLPESLSAFLHMPLSADSFRIKLLGGYKDADGSVQKIFEERLQLANSFFKTGSSGWRTDRGIIYIVFGSSDLVFCNGETETWVYSKSYLQPKAQFVFRRYATAKGEAEFILQRTKKHEGVWEVATDNWRHGKLF